MTRVLVVDDSRFIRTVVGDALAAAGYDVETAADGDSAIDAVATDPPDVITMDVEMPGVDGIEAVDRIMATEPTPIVMLSVHTESGADATMDALDRGAMAVLEKPTPGESQTLSDLTDDVVETVDDLASASTSALALARTSAAAHRSRSNRAVSSGPTSGAGAGGGSTTRSATSAGDGPAGPVTTDRSTEPTTSWADVDVEVESAPDPDPTIIVGASTGGPRIVDGLLRTVPRELNARFVIVQHMPGGFTERFADRLDQTSDYDVREAAPEDRVTAGEAVVAPGTRHLDVTAVTPDGVDLEHSPAPRVHGVRPAIDVTMESAAATAADGLVGVVLSGMGRDGARGIEAIRDAGGATFAQDEASSPVFGIPKQAIETGAVDEVVPAGSLPARLVGAVTGDAGGVTSGGETNG